MGNPQPFLSTPSARRATLRQRIRVHQGYISIHALCEEGDGWKYMTHLYVDISIHALCEEGDSMLMPSAAATAYFYPRPLRGGRPGAFQ